MQPRSASGVDTDPVVSGSRSRGSCQLRFEASGTTDVGNVIGSSSPNTCSARLSSRANDTPAMKYAARITESTAGELGRSIKPHLSLSDHTCRFTIPSPCGATVPGVRGSSLAVSLPSGERSCLNSLAPTHATSTIPLSGRALAILEARRGCWAGNDRVFPTTDHAVRMAWRRVKGRIRLPDFRFHDLRHEAISRFFEAGLSVPEVALLSGHRDPRMLFRYTHPRPGDVANKLSAL
jgi:hypothetical protein